MRPDVEEQKIGNVGCGLVKERMGWVGEKEEEDGQATGAGATK
jgi:hypothetical protein